MKSFRQFLEGFSYSDIQKTVKQIVIWATKFGYDVSVEEAATTLSSYITARLLDEDGEDLATFKIRVSDHPGYGGNDYSVRPGNDTAWEVVKALALTAKKPIPSCVKKNDDKQQQKIEAQELIKKAQIQASLDDRKEVEWITQNVPELWISGSNRKAKESRKKARELARKALVK